MKHLQKGSRSVKIKLLTKENFIINVCPFVRFAILIVVILTKFQVLCKMTIFIGYAGEDFFYLLPGMSLPSMLQIAS